MIFSSSETVYYFLLLRKFNYFNSQRFLERFSIRFLSSFGVNETVYDGIGDGEDGDDEDDDEDEDEDEWGVVLIFTESGSKSKYTLMIISPSSVVPLLFSSFSISNIMVLPKILKNLNIKLICICNHNKLIKPNTIKSHLKT